MCWSEQLGAIIFRDRAASGSGKHFWGSQMWGVAVPGALAAFWGLQSQVGSGILAYRTSNRVSPAEPSWWDRLRRRPLE